LKITSGHERILREIGWMHVNWQDENKGKYQYSNYDFWEYSPSTSKKTSSDYEIMRDLMSCTAQSKYNFFFTEFHKTVVKDFSFYKCIK
jgi:hypothetical protein